MKGKHKGELLFKYLCDSTFISNCAMQQTTGSDLIYFKIDVIGKKLKRGDIDKLLKMLNAANAKYDINVNYSNTRFAL